MLFDILVKLDCINDISFLILLFELFIVSSMFFEFFVSMK